MDNNWHAKTPCGNDLSTKWNMLGVQAMERYLEGDRKMDSRDDLMYVYLDKAIGYFIQAVAFDAMCSRAHMNLALCYLEKNQLESAIHHSGIAIKIKPDEARYFAIQSFIYEVSGLEENRKSSLQMALSYDKYISERKYFGILLSNVTDISKYIRFPLIFQVSIIPERIVARKFLMWIEFAAVSISDYPLLEPGITDGFIDGKYTVLRNILPPFLLREIQRCFTIGIKTGKIELTHAQATRFVTQNDRVGRILLFTLVDLFRKVIAHNVRPSYSYFGGYFNGSFLNPHSDRPQCEYTFSLTLEQNPPDKPWPLGMYRVPQFEKNDQWPGRDKEPFPTEKDSIWVDLLAGDGLLFMGRHMVHFRKGLLLGKDRFLNQIFLHYVQEYFNGSLD
jgi:hypothetical protein